MRLAAGLIEAELAADGGLVGLVGARFLRDHTSLLVGDVQNNMVSHHSSTTQLVGNSSSWCWQTSCAAAAVQAGQVARARLLHHSLPALLNPSMALTTALANSFRLREAAAAVARRRRRRDAARQRTAAARIGGGSDSARKSGRL